MDMPYPETEYLKITSYQWHSRVEMAPAVPFLTHIDFFFFNHNEPEGLYVFGSVKCFYPSSSQTYFPENLGTESCLI